VTETNGMFVTKVDVFFQAKDDTLPVWVELRTVRDGYPSQEIFPFSKIVKTPAEINLDATLELRQQHLNLSRPSIFNKIKSIVLYWHLIQQNIKFGYVDWEIQKLVGRELYHLNQL